MQKVDRSFEWKMPIDFYGRVVDQDSRPVPGATVRFGWTDTSARGSSEIIATSDASGRFSLRGQTGKRLNVRVWKDGYHSAGGKGGESFEYAAFFEGIYHRPAPENPVTFKLIKKLDPEPLIARHISERVGYDSSVYYDLQSGRLTPQPPFGPTLKFSFERSESPQGQPFDWTWKVEGMNAALVETNDEFAQVAPEEGYVPAWKASQSANGQPFEQGAQARFYVRTADNRFARVDVELAHPNSRNVGVRLTVNSFLNPFGSRNLEHDPNRETSVH